MRNKRILGTFEYYVFWSKNEAFTELEQRAGVYLENDADATYLKTFFDPLYETAGIGICTSDDETISGDQLHFLVDAVSLAVKDIEAQPREWKLITGYTFVPFQIELGEPIVKMASRERLLEFLEGVASIIVLARAEHGYVHFGGGC